MDPSILSPLPNPPNENERRAAVLRRDPRALALMLAPDPGLRAAGQQLDEGQLRRAIEARTGLGANFTQALQRAEEERQRVYGAQEMNQRASAQEAEQGMARERLQQGWAGLQQGRWQPVIKTDPNTGEMLAFMMDTRTGQIRSLPGGTGGATPGPVGGPAAPPRVKMNEQQFKTAASAGQVASAMQTALRVGFPTPGILGLPQSVGQMAARAGFPAFASPEAEQTFTAWYNVVRPLISIRTGQQMSVQELERELAGLAPRPGESEELHLQKVNQIIPLMRRYTVGLPPQIGMALNAEYDAIEPNVPKTVQQLRALRASGGGGMAQPSQSPGPAASPPPAPGPTGAPGATGTSRGTVRIPVTRGGVTRYWNGQSWED